MSMDRREFLAWLAGAAGAGAAGAGVAGLAAGCQPTAPAKPPNIVYILTDQWRAQSTGYNGDPNLVGKTPNLDKLAS